MITKLSQPKDWNKSHIYHKSYNSILSTSKHFTNALMILLANRLKVFDIIASSESS